MNDERDQMIEETLNDIPEAAPVLEVMEAETEAEETAEAMTEEAAEAAAEEIPALETEESEAEAEETAEAHLEEAAEAAPTEEQSEEKPKAVKERDSFGRKLPKPYYKRAYLLYGSDEASQPLDLAGTKEFLLGMGYDGGEMYRARQGKNYAEAIKAAANKDETSMYCSYCGREISGVDYYRMPDGRCRCTSCSRTLVRTKEELLGIYNRLLLNMEVFFGASIKVPIELEMLDERKLKKKIKKSLNGVDDKSILILGVAVNRKGKYSLYLENGAPRISVIATFAHELTHIWQYSHWDDVKGFPKVTGNTRLLIYEGMAKWVEIQYLYLIGETSVAKREEAYTRARKDEYGYGFCLYEDRYPLSREAMLCVDTPFKTDKFPID
jgi:Uncharacterized protein conserved in bacteria